jgi:hypothetical protein
MATIAESRNISNLKSAFSREDAGDVDIFKVNEGCFKSPLK